MKLGVICSSALSEHWKAVALATDAKLEMSVLSSSETSEDKLEQFLQAVDAVWAPGSTAASGSTAKPVLYNPAGDSQLLTTNAWPSLPLRQRPEIRHLKEVVASGKLGQIGTIRFSLCRSNTVEGPFSYTETLPNVNALELVGIHAIDAVRGCFGDIDRLHAVESNEAGTKAAYGVATARLVSGAILHIEASMAEPPGQHYLTYEIAGAKGILEYDSRKEPLVELATKKQAQPHPPPAELVAELRTFLTTDRSTLATPTDSNLAVQYVRLGVIA